MASASPHETQLVETTLEQRFTREVPKLMIGDIEVDNVPVSILPDERNLIGTDVLQRLGTFEIQRDALLVYGPSASTPHCETPLLIGTTFWGSPVAG